MKKQMFVQSGKSTARIGKSGDLILSHDGKILNMALAPTGNLITKIDDKFVGGYAVRSAKYENTSKNKLMAVCVDSEKQIERHLILEADQRYPDVIFIKTTYKNISKKTLHIDQIADPVLVLNASKIDKKYYPDGFHSFQGGASSKWKPSYDYVMNLGRADNNNMAQADVGGAVPVIDMWTRTLGIALVSVEKKQKSIYMPVKVRDDKYVEMGIKFAVDTFLKPGEILPGINSAIIIHKSDMFEGLKIYSKIMSDLGLSMKEPNADCYLPSWSSWGYEKEFKIKDIIKSIPLLKKLGVKVVEIDDGWFDYIGDWQPLKKVFKNGEKDFIQLIKKLHEEGFLVKLWWAPGNAQINSKVAKLHPEWLQENANGSRWKQPVVGYPTWYLCPSLPEVQEYHRVLVRKFMQKWGFDGFILDSVFSGPPCYSKKHGHKSCYDSVGDYSEIFKAIYEESIRIKKDAIVQICPCENAPNFYWVPWLNQSVTADPLSCEQLRHRVKVYKGLTGSKGAVRGDFIERSFYDFRKGEKETITNFMASALGSGAIFNTKFTEPDAKARKELKKWFDIYNKHMLSNGEFLNLYNYGFDVPEAYVIRKGGKYYYAFYKESFKGTLDLRGLDKNRRYKLTDYVNNKKLGFAGKNEKLKASFDNWLLILAEPV